MFIKKSELSIILPRGYKIYQSKRPSTGKKRHHDILPDYKILELYYRTLRKMLSINEAVQPSISREKENLCFAQTEFHFIIAKYNQIPIYKYSLVFFIGESVSYAFF